MLTLIIIIIILALLFDFLNGMNDAANAIATVVSTRVLSPRAAVLWAACFDFLGAFVFGVHVANTMGKGVVGAEFVDPWLLLVTLAAAVGWTHVCTQKGLPISVSHALVGGLIGTGLARAGTAALVGSGILKIALFIVIAPLLGALMGFGLMVAVFWTFRRATPGGVDRWFRRLQLVSAAGYALGHGTNDAQKTMGVIAVLLFTTGHLGSEFYVPTWVRLACCVAISLGTLCGGWKVIETLGMRMTKLRPVHGFCAETAAAASILLSTFGGIPVSTTHTITGAVIGVGATTKLSAVRWGVAYRILWAWVLTIPSTAIVSFIIFSALRQFGIAP